jgi:hypothetical protein
VTDKIKRLNSRFFLFLSQQERRFKSIDLQRGDDMIRLTRLPAEISLALKLFVMSLLRSPATGRAVHQFKHFLQQNGWHLSLVY